ncbi:hypothetical protein QBC38DRAFT_462439 [Podospora fimiseda]|uniref:Fungal STAND N-terminal Goodbye domain-containing protein n=1 Tax=Podospora fimiseda TaxID=252190 RepID=A0AAN6YL99_9PEZI|nr:hypothetical protein QBC38DRAFT_462439 [Podospora fimiseda]
MESSGNDLKGLWKEAVEEYARETRQNPSVNVETVTDVVAQIQASEAEFSAFRQKNERLYQALNVFVAPISAIASIAVTPASVVDYGTASSGVLSAVVYLPGACDGVTSAYDWVEQLFRELQDFSERLAQYIESAQLDPVLRRKIIAILAVLLKVIGRSQKLIHERRFRDYLRVTFLGNDSITKKLIDELNRTFESEQRYTVGVTYATTQRIEEAVTTIDDKVNRALDNIKADKDKKALAEDGSRVRNTLFDTSAPTDVEEIFVRNERVLLQGTDKWHENEKFFRDWMNREAFIQILRERNEDEDPVAYFFFENNENLRDANILLKTLAWKISNQDDEFRKHAVTVCCQRSRTITADLTWENFFLRFYNNPNST